MYELSLEFEYGNMFLIKKREISMKKITTFLILTHIFCSPTYAGIEIEEKEQEEKSSGYTIKNYSKLEDSNLTNDDEVEPKNKPKSKKITTLKMHYQSNQKGWQIYLGFSK